MNTGYRTCKGIPFGKEFENEMKDFAIPMVYVCDRNGCIPTKGYGSVSGSVSIDPSLSLHSRTSPNLSSYHHENVISNDIYDSFLKKVLYKPHSTGKGQTNIQIVEIPISNEIHSKPSSSLDTLAKVKTRKRKKSVKSNVKTTRKKRK